MSSVMPMTQEEVEQSTTKFGINGVTVFEWRLRTTGTNVLQALLAYFNVATKGAGKSDWQITKPS